MQGEPPTRPTPPTRETPAGSEAASAASSGSSRKNPRAPGNPRPPTRGYKPSGCNTPPPIIPGASRARFRSLWGSILEPSGLHFRASGRRFLEVHIAKAKTQNKATTKQHQRNKRNIEEAFQCALFSSNTWPGGMREAIKLFALPHCKISFQKKRQNKAD